LIVRGMLQQGIGNFVDAAITTHNSDATIALLERLMRQLCRVATLAGAVQCIVKRGTPQRLL
jgi:hypothetical protein